MGSVGFALGTGGGGGASAFAPTDVSSPALKLWLDASALTGLADADPITTLTDRSGNGNSGVGSGTGRPLYKTGIVNGLAVARFDGVNDTLTITRNAGLEPTTVSIFAVIRAAAAPTNFTAVLTKPITSGGSGSYAINTNGTGGIRPWGNVATSGEKFGTAVATGTVWDGSPHIVHGSLSGTSVDHWFDGAPQAGVAAVGNIVYDTNNLYVGSYNGASLFMAFDLCELLVYAGIPSKPDRWRVWGYLGRKWGLP